MDAIKELTQLNFSYVFVSVFIILIGIKAIVSLFEWLVEKLGIETKGMRHRREEHDLLIKTSEELTVLKNKHEEAVEQSILHDNKIKESIRLVSDKVDTLVNSLDEMKALQDKDKLSEYKDRIGQSYRYYRERKYSETNPIPYWNHMEKDALEGLVKQYEAHGGSNSFVHSVVEPEMQKWKVIEQEENQRSQKESFEYVYFIEKD